MPDAEINPPSFLKALGVVLGVGFVAADVKLVRDGLMKPFDVGLWIFALFVALVAWIFFGLLVWRTRLFVSGESLVVELRGYLGTKRRTFPCREIELHLDRRARYGLFARTETPKLTVKHRSGDVLFIHQYEGIEAVAERLAEKTGLHLRGK